jgi:hypothetical protein
MSCVLGRGFLLSCNEGVGGIKDIYIGLFSDFQNAITIDPTTKIITAMDAVSPAVRLSLYPYQANRNTGGVTIAPNANLENGTLFYTHTVEMTLGKLDNDKKVELEQLAKTRVVVFVRLFDDKIMMIGRQDGCFLTAGTFSSGKARADLNGYQITLTAEEPNQPDFLAQYDDVPFDNFPDVEIWNDLP